MGFNDGGHPGFGLALGVKVRLSEEGRAPHLSDPGGGKLFTFSFFFVFLVFFHGVEAGFQGNP